MKYCAAQGSRKATRVLKKPKGTDRKGRDTWKGRPDVFQYYQDQTGAGGLLGVCNNQQPIPYRLQKVNPREGKPFLQLREVSSFLILRGYTHIFPYFIFKQFLDMVEIG